MKKNNPRPITKQQDSFDLLLEGVVQIIESAIVFVCKHSWSFLSEKISNGFSKNDSKQLDMDTLNAPRKKWSRWELPLYSHCLGKETDFEKVDFNKNTLVMGTTGQGKNVLMDSIINERLKEGLPVVFIAPKGDREDVEKFKLLNELHGRASVVISDALNEDHFNPIAEGSVAAITERIHSSFQWSEQYYSDIAYNALKESIEIIKNPAKRVRVKRVKSKDSDKGYKEISEKIDVVGNTTPTFLKIEQVLNQLFPLESSEREKAIGIINKISKINSSSYSQIFNNEDGWTFEKIRRERRSIIFSISNLRFPDLCKMLGRVIVLDLQNHASDIFELPDCDKGPVSPMSVVIDELGTVATASFINLWNQCRGAKLSVMAAFQCLSDLDTVPNSFKARVISNTNNFFIGSMKHPEDAELLSKMVGTNRTKKTTKRTQNDEELEDGSVRDAHEFVIPPDLLKGANTAIFIVKTFLGPHAVNDIVTVKMKFTKKNIEKMIKRRVVRFEGDSLKASYRRIDEGAQLKAPIEKTNNVIEERGLF